MPGFLSLFDATEKIVLSPEGADREYWVEVRHYLSSDEEDEITAASLGLGGMQLTAIAGLDKQQIQARLDTAASQRVLLLHSILNWNLTNRAGDPLPLAPQKDKARSIASLPGGVRDLIAKRLADIRADQRRTPAERAAFRESAQRGDLDGVNGAGGAPRVQDGGILLEAPGAQEV